MNIKKTLLFAGSILYLISSDISLGKNLNTLRLSQTEKRTRAQSLDGYTAQLMLAIVMHDHTVLRLLLNQLNTTNINDIYDEDKNRLLLRAIQYNNKMAVFMLFAMGADPSSLGHIKFTPLQSAKALKHKTIANMIETQLDLQKNP